MNTAIVSIGVVQTNHQWDWDFPLFREEKLRK
ncbi:hypothetical protein IG3_05589 [Bacillus cereus HuA2-1]|uniref:Uncharacterized protein n=1 Tax=Bacillus cereus HuA2-1 TaxID=1053201 RepID=J9B8D1_BACCE|nr:hypothetical protein IG3_05589 [Bacillus cereus HuA2-1]